MQILSEYIEKKYRETNRTPETDAGAIHPSWLDDCDRLTIYRYLGLRRDMGHSDFLKRIFFHGHRIEEWMNEALRARDMFIANSIPVRAEFNGVRVEGEIDHIVRWNGGVCIADTKSVSDSAFKYKSFPYGHHVMQVGTYDWALEEMYKSGTLAPVSLGWLLEDFHGPWLPPLLLYVGRGNLVELPPISIGDARQLVEDKLNTVTDYINADLIPHRPFATPEEHPYLCARRTRKGYKKKSGTYSEGKEPEYVPSCAYFERCWGTMPDRWSFWFKELPKELLPMPGDMEVNIPSPGSSSSETGPPGNQLTNQLG